MEKGVIWTAALVYRGRRRRRHGHNGYLDDRVFARYGNKAKKMAAASHQQSSLS